MLFFLAEIQSQMEKLTHPSIQLLGIQLPQKTTNEGGQSMADCGNLWQRFEKEKIFQQIPEKLSNAVYAVYFDYDGDHTQPFQYFIGSIVKAGTETPEGLSSLNIPEQQYEKVQAKGKMPDCIGVAWQSIWQSDLDRAFTYDFEVYDERSHNWSDAEVDIFLAVKA